jgi:amino-acid N-acetyltransferase
VIRKAALFDVKTIHKIIAEQAMSGHILARAMSELYSHIRDFSVFVDDETGEIRGCGAVQIVWEDLAEIRSLAVLSAHQGKRIGSTLITTLMDEARGFGIKQVFVLTYRVTLFEKLGFAVMNKNMLPHKIWADCIKCTKFPECDEIAMVGNP